MIASNLYNPIHSFFSFYIYIKKLKGKLSILYISGLFCITNTF